MNRRAAAMLAIPIGTLLSPPRRLRRSPTRGAC